MPSAPERSLGDPEAIRRLLTQPEARTILSALKARDADQVQAAAQAALKGDAAALRQLLASLNLDPRVKGAIDRLDRSAR